MEDASVLVVMVMLSVFSICGTIGNSLVLYIYSHKKEKSTAGIFIMSLAGTDLFTCLFIMPYTEAVVYLQYYLKYDAACKIYMFFITCNIPFAAFIMVAIAMDRYFCICHPFLHVLNIHRSKLIVIILLLIASTFGLITSLSHGVYAYQEMPPDTFKPNDTLVLSSGQNLSLSGSTHPVNMSENAVFDPIASLDELYKPLLSVNDTDLNQANLDFNLNNQSKQVLTFHGYCMPNDLIIDDKFLDTYQIVYAGTYILSFIIVVVLYGLIYKSIHEHRAKRSKRKRSSLYPSPGIEFSNAETQLTAVTHVNPHGKRSDPNAAANGEPEQLPELQPMRPKPRTNSKALSIKEKTLLANIRTAMMLFVVTIVFLIAFLPAWLMASKLLTYNQVVFYMYFVYHSANPFIYAFMNKSFRDDLGKVIKCQSMPMVR